MDTEPRPLTAPVNATGALYDKDTGQVLVYVTRPGGPERALTIRWRVRVRQAGGSDVRAVRFGPAGGVHRSEVGAA